MRLSMARTDGLKREGQFTKENAAAYQARAVEKRKLNQAKDKAVADVLFEILTPEDITKIAEGIIQGAKDGKKDSLEMLLKLIGQYPNEKQTIDLRMQSYTAEDLALMQTVKEIYESQ